MRVRKKVSGTAERPRMTVFRSNKQIYVQFIDDLRGVTLASASSLDKEVVEQMKGINKCQEAAIVGKEPGEKVSFTLAPADGYGEIVDDAIVDLPKTIFMVDGKLAEDILFVGSQIPMANAQGQRMLGVVKEIGDDTVKMDFNHPMAGKTLNFDVEVISVRDVTPEDLAGKCSCGECSCGDDCHCEGESHADCGCHGCH